MSGDSELTTALKKQIQDLDELQKKGTAARKTTSDTRAKVEDNLKESKKLTTKPAPPKRGSSS